MPMASTTSPDSLSASSIGPEFIDGKSIRHGDVLIGLPSVGLHTNGYSLARKLFFEIAKLHAGFPCRRAGRNGRRRTAEAARQL